MNKIFDHVIFDCDGVIIDTEHLYFRIFDSILSKYGHSYDWTMKAQLMGKDDKRVSQIVCEHYKLPIKSDEFYDEVKNRLAAELPFCSLVDGVENLIHLIHSLDVPMAVATGSGRHFFELKSQKHQNIFKFFKAIVTGDDPGVKDSKPAPDVYLMAAKELGVVKEQDLKRCLAIEDAPNGVMAALSAGMEVIWVPDAQLLIDKELASNPRVHIYKKMSEVNIQKYLNK